MGSQSHLQKGEHQFPFVAGTIQQLPMAFNSDRRLIKDFTKFNKLQQVDEALKRNAQQRLEDNMSTISSNKVTRKLEEKIALSGKQSGTNFSESAKHLI